MVTALNNHEDTEDDIILEKVADYFYSTEDGDLASRPPPKDGEEDDFIKAATIYLCSTEAERHFIRSCINFMLDDLCMSNNADCESICYFLTRNFNQSLNGNTISYYEGFEKKQITFSASYISVFKEVKEIENIFFRKSFDPNQYSDTAMDIVRIEKFNNIKLPYLESPQKFPFKVGLNTLNILGESRNRTLNLYIDQLKDSFMDGLLLDRQKRNNSTELKMD